MIFYRALGVKISILGLNAAIILLLPWVLGSEGYAAFAILSSAMALAIGTFRTPIEVLIQRSFQKSSTEYLTFYGLSKLLFIFILSVLGGAFLFSAALKYAGYEVVFWIQVFFGFGAAAGILSGVRRGILIISHQTDRVDILDLFARPAFFLTAILFLAFLSVETDFILPILFGISFILVLTLPNLRAFQQIYKSTVSGEASCTLDWIKLVASSALSAMRKSGDVIILASVVGGPIVGSYFILVRITDLLAFGNNFANLRYTHRFAKAVRDGDDATRRLVVHNATRLSLTFALVGAVLALTLGPWVLPMIQAELENLYLPFSALIGAQVVNGLFGPRGAFLTSQWPGVSLAIKSANSVFGLGILYFLTVEFGLTGTACAVAASTITGNILVAITFLRLTRILSKNGTKT